MKKILLLVLSLAAPVLAQDVPPALMVKQGDKSEPLHLSRITIEVWIFGYVAETTTTMTFANQSDRVLEGDLYFPLPEGATISGYALDIEGRMVDGVAVEKHKGREVFESIVRRGIDPGLIEWAKGNNFKTRVFPIPAHGSRTIRVSFVSELIGDRGDPAYFLPLKHKQKVDEFSLRAEVVKPQAVPEVRRGAPAGFHFRRWRDSFVAEAKLTDTAPNEDLVIALPNVQKQNVLVERAGDGQTYFVVHDFPQPPGQAAAVSAPRHVVVYWDASASRGGSDHLREIHLLQAALDGFLPPGQKSPGFTVDLVLFRNTAETPQRFKWTNLNARGDRGNHALMRELAGVQYDGGTQLGALTPPPGAPRPDFYLLFTDGLSNFGREMPERLEAPVYAFSADSTANHALLRQLATASGGRYFNLTRVKDAGVLESLGRSPYSFLSATVDAGKAGGSYPQLPQPVGGRFALVGRLSGDRATVTLNYGRDGKTVHSKSFQISAADAAEGSLLRRLWAQKKLADLITFENRNEEEITALGKEFGMVTPFTSLIVLDSLEQYVEHEVAPPKSLPEMRRQYVQQIDTIEHQRRKQKDDKLAAVLAMWQQRVKWWATEFKYPQGFKYKPPAEGRDSGGGGDMPSMGSGHGAGPSEGAPPPALVPPPTESPAPAGPSPEPSNGGGQDAAPDAEEAFGGEDSDEDKADDSGRRRPGIAIKPWDPKTPYLKELGDAKPQAAFEVYMKQRAEFGTSPAFFLDCAHYFHNSGRDDLSLQVLSNVAEMELESPQLLRVLGHRLLQRNDYDLAVLTFEEVLRLRPEEPQSYRDLALALARRAGVGQIRQDYTRAIELLARVVMGHWDGRFEQIELIALEELNALLPRARALGVKEFPLDRRLIKLLEVDVRIVMTWHADNTDIDLWVIEPSGEQADYSHNRTTIGGLVSADFTGGYGPEEYMVRRAMPGMYTIKANYYGSAAARLLGSVTVQVDVFTNYGREGQRRKSITVELKDKEETVDIGRIEF